ncbi:MAG: hypothetical protein DRI65_15095 [Chloroflexota bacterium]|nr:MAG: hypothetical protein DRI65_15095 [Chloroflexota bacterium]
MMTDEERDKARDRDIQRAKEAKAIGVAVLDEFFEEHDRDLAAKLLEVTPGNVEGLVHLQLTYIAISSLREFLKGLINNGQLAEHNRAHDTKH